MWKTLSVAPFKLEWKLMPIYGENGIILSTDVD